MLEAQARQREMLCPGRLRDTSDGCQCRHARGLVLHMLLLPALHEVQNFLGHCLDLCVKGGWHCVFFADFLLSMSENLKKKERQARHALYQEEDATWVHGCRWWADVAPTGAAVAIGSRADVGRFRPFLALGVTPPRLSARGQMLLALAKANESDSDSN